MKTKILLFCSLLILSGNFLFAQLPFAGTNAGTEFVFSLPPCYDVPGQNFIRLYVASLSQTDVTVKANGFVRQKKTIPNGVIEFELSPAMAQAYLLPGIADAPPEQVWPEAAVQVTSGAPIIVYAVTRFQYTSDGFLVIPVSALGKEYVVASYPDMTAMYPGLVLPSLTTITAAYDGTKVRFTLGGNTVTRTSGGMRPGQTKEFTMNRGDVVVVSSKGDEADMSGSKVVANKPVAVTSGNMCANVPTQSPWCDFISEMELPTYLWGKEYPVGKFINRQYNSIIRIYAKENDTKWYVNGKETGTIAVGGGGKKNEAWVEYRVPGAASNYVISADKPIYVMLYNTGQSDDNVVSDPFEMLVLPSEQYQTEITFSTPGVKGGVGFARNYLNLICPLTADNLIPDDIEFAKVDGITGKFVWKKLSAEFGGNIGEKFPVWVADKPYTSKILTLSGDGIYKVRSKSGENKIAAYSYGFSDYDSYGFPAAVMTKNLLDREKPVPTFEKHCNGDVIGQVEDFPRVSQSTSLRSNIANIFLDPDSSANYQLSSNFIAGDAQIAQWSLAVKDRSKPAQAMLRFADRGGNDTTISIVYVPNLYDISGVSNFLVKKREAVTRSARITNFSNNDMVITNVFIVPSNIFSLKNITLPITIAPHGMIDIPLAIDTETKGKFTSTIYATNGCDTIANELSITVDIPKIAVTDIDFNKTPTNTSVENYLIVKNTGQLYIYITGFEGPDKVEFAKVDGLGKWQNFSLPPGAETKLNAKFTPKEIGSFSTRITFLTDSITEGKNYSDWTGSAIVNSVDEISELCEIKISPNPAQNFVLINLEKNSEKPLEIFLFNSAGEKILSEKISSGEQSVKIDVSKFSNGSYYLQFGASEKLFPLIIAR